MMEALVVEALVVEVLVVGMMKVEDSQMNLDSQMKVQVI